jgi:hypothetical protein
LRHPGNKVRHSRIIDGSDRALVNGERRCWTFVLPIASRAVPHLLSRAQFFARKKVFQSIPRLIFNDVNARAERFALMMDEARQAHHTRQVVHGAVAAVAPDENVLQGFEIFQPYITQ